MRKLFLVLGWVLSSSAAQAAAYQCEPVSSQLGYSVRVVTDSGLQEARVYSPESVTALAFTSATRSRSGTVVYTFGGKMNFQFNITQMTGVLDFGSHSEELPYDFRCVSTL